MTNKQRNATDVFIEGWGRMGGYWGVGKTMAEIQALLFLSPEPLSLDDMSERLKMSRSNVSFNVRGLQDLGVVKKVIIPADRKDYYVADRDVARVARRLAKKKKERELDPAREIVSEALDVARSNRGTDVTGDIAGNVSIQRLDELLHLMEVISDMFDTFIGEPAGARSNTEVNAQIR